MESFFVLTKPFNIPMKHIDKLKKVQASTYLILIKTHGNHWNIEGPNFKQLHDLFQAQYEELFLAVDEISERLRALKVEALYSPEDFLEISNIKKGKGLEDLINSHELLIKDLYELKNLCEEDPGTQDLAISRIKAHEKQAWMLRSSL